MATFLRPLAYRYRWIYDSVTAVSSLSVGGVQRLRSLGLESLQQRLKPGAAVLDLCCGVGGKTTHISSLMKNQGLIVALDRARSKIKKLRDRCEVLGITNPLAHPSTARELLAERHCFAEINVRLSGAALPL